MKRADARGRWQKYEHEKRRLQREGLEPAEYERRLREIARRMRV